MLEAFVALIALGAVAVAVAAVVGIVLLVVRLALIPIAIALAIVKVVVIAVLAIAGVVVVAALGIPLLVVGAVLFLPLLLLGGLVAAVRRLFQVLGGDNRGEDRAAALAGYGALAAAAVHSALDFGLTIPANALGLAVLVGAAVGTPVTVNREQTPSRRRRRSKRAAVPAAAPERDGGEAAPEPSAPAAP